MIGGSMDVSSTFMQVQQYKQIMHKKEIPYDSALLAVRGGYGVESGYALVNELLGGGALPTAVIAINGFVAMGIIRRIAEHGYRIPGDISVVSQDNTFLAQITIPNLTSVDYDYEEFGRKLIATALNVIEGREVAIRQTVTPKLVVRESSGMSPAGK